jgi:glycosyltransferase involved in cell wall biosynthesis
MNKYKKRTLFLYYDPNFFHAALAKALHADFYPAPKLRSEKSNIINGGLSILKSVFTLPRNYDIYFCEGTYIIPALAKKLGLLKKETKIVNILASPLLYYIKTGVIFGSRRRFAINLLKEVDLFVCVGKMEEELLKEILPDAKSIVTYPYLKPEIKKKLISKKSPAPNLYSHRILTIGTNSTSYYKGIDIAFNAFKMVKRRFPDAEFDIVGNMPDLEEYVDCSYKGVHCLGYVEDLAKKIKESSLYIHVGRGDAFPVSTIEAMCGGLPAIVSNANGTKEIIEKVDKNMISKLDAKDLANKIIKYFDSDHKEKKELSKKFYKIGFKFDKDHIIEKFVNDFNGALK